MWFIYYFYYRRSAEECNRPGRRKSIDLPLALQLTCVYVCRLTDSYRIMFSKTLNTTQYATSNCVLYIRITWMEVLLLWYMPLIFDQTVCSVLMWKYCISMSVCLDRYVTWQIQVYVSYSTKTNSICKLIF